jgi:predicted DNA-binding transcriptional regulator AlpA
MLAKRGLSRKEAAAYVGVAPSTFDRMVKANTFPGPVNLPGTTRKIWDLKAIDKVFDPKEVEETDFNRWLDKLK